MNEIWILGATGRIGRAVAAKLAAAELSLVLVGRDEARLRALARTLGTNPRIVVAGSVDVTALELSKNAPAVVINTIGPFTQTALRVVRACPPGTHYVDMSNELPSILAVLELHGEAAALGQTLVTGAGFGVFATESVVLKLCAGRPPAAQVRVDAVASVETEAGTFGSALAASVIDGLVDGGREYQGGKLVRTSLGSSPQSLTLPDGLTLNTASAPSGELEAAQRASAAPSVVAASNMAFMPPLARRAAPALVGLLRVGGIRTFAKRQIGNVKVKAAPKPRAYSWGHAQVQWASGETREGWLRAGEGMDFTAAVAANVATRLARGEGRPGAYTPGALFGPDLAEEVGGQFLLDLEAT